VEELKDELTFHLRDRVLSDKDNQRLLNAVGAQHDRARVLSFLTEESVEATNNRAERDLRPAVIARKVSRFHQRASNYPQEKSGRNRYRAGQTDRSSLTSLNPPLINYDLKTAPVGIEIKAILPIERTVRVLQKGNLVPLIPRMFRRTRKLQFPRIPNRQPARRH
jgi:Transposase IS66 family